MQHITVLIVALELRSPKAFNLVAPFYEYGSIVSSPRKLGLTLYLPSDLIPRPRD